MTKQVRQERILRYLEIYKTAQIAVLSRELNVSMVTIRHDLDEMENNHKVIRSHGGALLADKPVAETSILSAVLNPLNIPNLQLKEAIAAEAVKLIDPMDSIFLGGGTTFYIMAKFLKSFKDLKIVTTNVSVVYALAPYNKNIYFIGGELIEMNGIYYTGGPKIPLELEKIYVNKAFIGISGIDLNGGLTIYDLSQLNMHMSVPKIACNIILVADATKFGYQSAHKIGPIQDVVDTIVTNKSVDERYRLEFERLGIRFITA